MQGSTFKYENLAQKLLKQIAVARLQPGDRLPTEDELVQQHGLSRITVRRALLILEEGGYVSRRRKLGTVVAKSIEGAAQMHLVRGSVAIVVPNVTADREEDHALSSLLRGMESTLADQGFSVQILGVGKDLVQDRARLERIAGQGGLEGICTVGGCIDPLRDLLRSIPTIYSCTFTPNGSPWIGFNIQEATNICTNYLLDRGHDAIAMLCGSAIDSKAFARLIAGYRQAFESHRVPFNRTLIHQAYDGESLEELVEQILSARPAPTAVVAQEWRVTRAVVRAAQKLGKRIPDDLSIIGIGQNTLFVPSPTAITAYIPDNERVGREAALALVGLIDTKTSNENPTYVQGKLIERDSVSRRR